MVSQIKKAGEHGILSWPFHVHAFMYSAKSCSMSSGYSELWRTDRHHKTCIPSPWWHNSPQIFAIYEFITKAFLVPTFYEANCQSSKSSNLTSEHTSTWVSMVGLNMNGSARLTYTAFLHMYTVLCKRNAKCSSEEWSPQVCSLQWAHVSCWGQEPPLTFFHSAELEIQDGVSKSNQFSTQKLRVNLANLRWLPSY